jgi:hypothetical protein
MKFILIIFVLAISFVSVSGQTESDLKKYFEGSMVFVKIDMPASAIGVNVYVQRNPQIKIKKHKVQLHGDGISIHSGDQERITKIKVKEKHIELQLGGGGYTGSDIVSNDFFVPEPVSIREGKLEKKLKKETNPERRREISKKLKSERQLRESADYNKRSEAEAKTAIVRRKIARDRLDYGSRFNIRFDRKITAQDLTPQAIMDALAAYVDF